MTPPQPLHDNPELETLLNYVKRNRGFDFSGYKRSSLTRRIMKRMETLDIDSFTDYGDYLEVHPHEFVSLFNNILINVTSFFRDSVAWEYIASDVIPAILAGKAADEQIRVWSAGCASGEEAYTVALLFAEAMGIDGFRERVKIYASDIDEDALAQARQAVYTVRDIAAIPRELLEKYFEQHEQRYIFRKDLRRSVIFGRHDLLQDAPISRIDLLICRNVLMYFNAEAQSKILSRFHFALNDTGFLFLGKAEMLFTHANFFTPTDLKRRVFVKVPRAPLRERYMLTGNARSEEAASHRTQQIRFREAAFDIIPVAQMVVDLNGFVSLINEHARILLGLSAKDLGRPLQDLDVVYRISELKTQLEDVYLERRPVMLKEADWLTTSGNVHTLEIRIAPLVDDGKLLGASISFVDISRYKRLQEELEHSNQELETAYEELQATNEELETTNEELQSTIEELETTNEELQSTNEELETMNEELQSTNEELQTINEELRRRTDELNEANAFLESILASLRGAVVVVDQDLLVQVWNQKAEDMWGLRASEAQGKNFLYLDIGLPVDQLKQPIRSCLLKDTDFHEMVVQATNRRGKSILCKVICTPFISASARTVRGVILIIEEVED